VPNPILLLTRWHLANQISKKRAKQHSADDITDALTETVGITEIVLLHRIDAGDNAANQAANAGKGLGFILHKERYEKLKKGAELQPEL
jgi:hypothetical protein